jgi:hypothetical protein
VDLLTEAVTDVLRTGCHVRRAIVFGVPRPSQPHLSDFIHSGGFIVWSLYSNSQKGLDDGY